MKKPPLLIDVRRGDERRNLENVLAMPPDWGRSDSTKIRSSPRSDGFDYHQRTMRNMLLLLTLVAGLCTTPSAQIAAPASAPGAFAADWLARIDRVFQQFVDENRLAGAVTLVLQDGKPVYERAFGWRDKEAGRKMTTDTIFRIASQTKALTSVVILSLVEEGKIALSDPAGRYIPAFAKTTVAVSANDGATIVPARRPITIRDLLTHTAGISYGTDRVRRVAVRGQGTRARRRHGLVHGRQGRADLRRRWSGSATLPFVAQPGEAWVYGYNTDILGCIAERASGMPLDALIRTRITGPLGMKDTQFFLPPAQRDRLAAVYSSGADGTIVARAGGTEGAGPLRGRAAQELRRRRRTAVDGARLRALPRDDPQRRHARRRPRSCRRGPLS